MLAGIPPICFHGIDAATRLTHLSVEFQSVSQHLLGRWVVGLQCVAFVACIGQAACWNSAYADRQNFWEAFAATGAIL
jgi:hypothetical protein